MYEFPWKYFPARLHSTREIIFFLENIKNIRKIINDNPSDLTNCIFGDIYHSFVKDDSIKFMNTNINRNICKIIIEISSRKVKYYNDIPINYYYSGQIENNTYKMVDKILSDEEIKHDICHIIKLCKNIFNENIEIHIIPHLNLKTKSNNDYIYDRNSLVRLLECVCNEYNIKIHNIGKYIESKNKDAFLEDYMSDSTHYSKYYTEIKQFLRRAIGV